jgi:rSAM/selenodomain-associated transferase 2
MTPRLTIVVPVLNEAMQIVACLRALAPLRAQGAEVIVADGGSTDATTEWARPLADQVLQCPRGRARQMNFGAAQARGQTLLFLHADTGLPSDALSAIHTALANPRAHWGRFDVRIEGRPRLLKLVATMMNLRSRVSGIATGDQALFVRRDSFLRVGGFPDQPLMEDIEFSKRLCRFARPVCLYQRVTTSGRRWERDGVWRTIALMWRLRWLYWIGTPPERLARLYE